MGNSKNTGSKEAAQVRADEQARQDRIRAGTEKVNQTFGQFDDKFFSGRQKAFLDYARPQLDDQHTEAQKQLTYSLARSNLLDSSVRGEKAALLQKTYDTNLRGVTDEAANTANMSRNAIEDARANVLSMLNATGDASGASNAALARATALSTPATFSPLTNLFADFTSGLGQQAALEKAYAASGGMTGAPRYQTGLFAPRPGAVRVSGG
jgi:hypothetical protein